MQKKTTRTCCFVQVSMWMERTKLTCTPKLRWRPAHSRQINVPWLTLPQSVSNEGQSAHFWLPSKYDISFNTEAGKALATLSARAFATAEAISFTDYHCQLQVRQQTRCLNFRSGVVVPGVLLFTTAPPASGSTAAPCCLVRDVWRNGVNAD